MECIKVTQNDQEYYYLAPAEALPCMVLERAILFIADWEGLSTHNTQLSIKKTEKQGCDPDTVTLDNLLSIPIYTDNAPTDLGEGWVIYSAKNGHQLTVEKRTSTSWIFAKSPTFKATIVGEVVEYEKKQWFI